MAQQVTMGIERRLLAHISKKYPKPMHEISHKLLEYPTLAMQKRRAEEKRLFQVLSQLPQWGIGRLVTSWEWRNEVAPTFWRITRVHVDHEVQNLEYGIAWGIFTENGRCHGYEEEVRDMNEHLWRLIPKYNEHTYTDYKAKSVPIKEVPLYVPAPPLLNKMMKSQMTKEENENKVYMVRTLLQRGYNNNTRQRMPDGSLV